MKIVVIGGSGLIGSKVVARLNEDGHDPLSASPDSGVDSITGEGLAQAMEGAEVVVDVTNAPTWDDAAVLDFFQTSTRNLLAAEGTAGVTHHVALSVVGADRLPDSGYLRAKVAQETLIERGAIPFTILRATQFFEFIGRIADSATAGDTVRLPGVQFQPAAAADIAGVVAEIAESSAANAVVELGGPEPFLFDQLVARFLEAQGDPRRVVTDPRAPYFGTELNTESLTPGAAQHLTSTSFDDWLENRKPGLNQTKGTP